MQTSTRRLEALRHPQVRVAWLPRAVLSGFMATVVMTFTFFLAYGVGHFLASLEVADRPGAELIQSWFLGLTQNPVVDLAASSLYAAIALHFAVGLVWALVYAYWAEPRLSGPGWLRGVAFSLVPWVLSLVVFLPLVGGGFLGLGLGAGPLPMLGNLILHLAYGATLGALYGPWGDVLVEEVGGAEVPDDTRAMIGSERSAAWGTVLGLVLGAAVGIAVWAIVQSRDSSEVFGLSMLAFILASILVGGTFGALVGSLAGLSAGTGRPVPPPTPRRRRRAGGRSTR